MKLPPVPRGQFSRAFIGAKLGRAKTTPNPERPWEHTVVPGKIYMAVSQRPAFVSEQSFFLAETQDIPVESDGGINLPGTGRSEWFWTEVPLNHVSSEQSNYLVIWSPTREFRSAAASPILAAKKPAAPAQTPRAWNNNSIMGVPPRMEGDSLKVPIVLQPAMAIKLVPNYKKKPAVSDFSVVDADGDQVVARFSVQAKDVELSWIEMSQDELEWERFSSYRRGPPQLFTFSRAALPPRGAYIRARARDSYGNDGESATAFIMGKGGQ